MHLNQLVQAFRKHRRASLQATLKQSLCVERVSSYAAAGDNVAKRLTSVLQPRRPMAELDRGRFFAHETATTSRGSACPGPATP